MKLRELTGGIIIRKSIGDTDILINGLSFDSRIIVEGNLFFAIRGTTSDGHDFIEEVLRRGAAGIVCETVPVHVKKGVCYLVVENSNIALGEMASAFYGNPSGKMHLIGVTGTNGKTTTATLLYRLFLGLGYSCGLISTIINKINTTSFPATHTTPDPIRTNELMSRMAEAGCAYCFMEVSSHAIDQERISGLTFAGGIFTNLTHDHLDYHKTFEAYLKAKKHFFDLLPSGSFALVNKDDKHGSVMLQNTLAGKYTYSLHGMADFRCIILENQFSGLQLAIDGIEVWFKLIGTFNAYNLLSAYAAATLLGQDKNAILTILSQLEPVDGRFNYVRSPDHVTAIVDYAHTPDALQNVLETINTIRGHHEQLITVVGAGGNRDVSKRPIMASIACTFSDRVIFTSDNPRFEDPESILADMKQGVEPSQAWKVLTIVNREEAIKTACALAQPGDILLVAGKGHEAYQDVRGVKHPFNDKEILQAIFKNIHTINP